MSSSPRLAEKSWNPGLEEQIRRRWTINGTPGFNIMSNRKKFVIDTPPPYPSGRPWHIGAAAHYSQIDMIARTARMTGHEVYFPIGIDRNGLPVEIYAEKKYNISIRTTPREQFISTCSGALDDLEAEMLEVMKMMGLSGDFEHYYRTDSEDYRSFTQATFIELWKQGRIYEATRPNNYCSKCNTTIADAEVGYEEQKTQLVYIKFKLVDRKEELVIATTRPELLCSCKVVIVHPTDERFIPFHGAHVFVPLFGGKVKILPHPTAKPDFGSGAVMICSYGDYTDVILFRELGLQEAIAVGKNGKMSEIAGVYQGLTLREARSKIINDLQHQNLLVKTEEIVHRTPICERSHTPIEIIPMQEYYLKQVELTDELKTIAKQIIFHPEEHRQILLNWLESVTLDWPITRRRYYGTEVPIWYCSSCGQAHLPEPGKYYRPWRDPPPFDKCNQCGNTEFAGEQRTFDTWMDSSISPLYIAKRGRDSSFFSQAYPISIRPQAKDIVRTWLYYTILRCYQLTGNAPFQHAWIMGYGVDEKGRRMSKSIGNVVDPQPILKKYGADAFRLWAASEAILGSDFRCSEERIVGTGKFLNKVWNLARFISIFPVVTTATLSSSDQWILAELSAVSNACRKGYDEFNFFIPANRIREFVWNIFAPHYSEMVKSRAYGTDFSREEQEAAWYTLHTTLKTILVFLAPIIPFFSDYIWTSIYGGETIHNETFSNLQWPEEMTELTPKIAEFTSHIWNTKKARGLSLKDSIEIAIPENLQPFRKDLVAMHRLVQS